LNAATTMPGPSSPGTVYPIPLSDVGCTYATNQAPAPQPQPQTMVRGDTDMDAAAALLGFRAVAEHEQDSSGLHVSAMSSAAPAAASDQSRQEVLEAHLPPKKRRSQKSLGRALPLNQRPVPTALLLAQAGLQASPSAAALAPAPAPAAAARPKISRFPERLMEMLSDETITDSICWLPHGRSFLVVNPTKFTHDVQPEYFGACKFASFTRKLYRWGFRQISKGPDAESYFHRLFRRDEPDLCEDMICKEEIRDGCPELHGGINDYTLMRMEQADRLQELMKKNLDTKKKLDIARVVKLREQQKAAAAAGDPRQVHFQAPQVPVQRPQMATAATVDLTGSLSPQLPGATPPQLAGVTGRSNLPGGGGIGLVQRHLLRIEKRRTELQAALQDEIIKRKSIADTKRRYTQLLAEQEEQYRRLLLQQQQQQQQQQQLYSEEPPRPDRLDTVAESKRRYAELLARQGRLDGRRPQMQASPGMAPAHTVPTIHHQLLPGQDQTKVAKDVAITGTFYPSLPKHHYYQEPSTDHLKSCLKKSSSYSVPSSLAPPSFSSHSLLLAKQQQQQQQHAVKLLSQHYPDHAVAALHHPSPQSAHALAILRASLEQQHKEGLSSHAPAAPGKSNVVAAGVINRALDTLHREGFA